MKLNLNNHYPIIHQQGNLLYLNNGNVCLVYRLSLPEVFSQSEEDFGKLHGQWQQAFKNLPSGTIVHKQDLYLRKAFDPEPLPGSSFLARATREYFHDREYLEHRSYLIFSWPKNRAFNKGALSNPFVKIRSSIPENSDQNFEIFRQAVQEAISYLNNASTIECIPANADEIHLLTEHYFNGFQKELDTDILRTGKDLFVGDIHFGVIAINSELCFGDRVATSIPNSEFARGELQFHQGFLDRLGLSLGSSHLVNQVVWMDDRQRWLQILNKKREELKKSINFGTQNSVILERIEDILKAINNDDQARIIRGQTSIIFWEASSEELSKVRGRIISALKELDIRAYQPIGSELQRYFLNSFFGHTSNFDSEDWYVTDLQHALCLWINNSNYRSDREGVIFNDRLTNIPIIKDVWDADKKRIKARNFAIFAPTGEGKSFLANNILRQYFEAGVRLVIIDLGGSYAKFAKLYPDDHIILRYEQGKSLGINPFYVPSAEEIDTERIEDLSGFILELVSIGKKPVREQKVALRKVLFYYYKQKGRNYSLQDFYQFLKVHKASISKDLELPKHYFDTDHFLHILSEYTGQGIYNFLFSDQEDQTYRIEDKRLIIFELDEVRDNQELLSVMLRLIKTAIQRTIWKNRAERGIILFDEFAKQLKFENVLESVEFYYQAIRKQNGAIGIILQSINQLPENAVSASILENTQVTYILHNEKGYRELQRRLNLSGHDLDQLHSMQNDLKGKYRYTEVFIKLGREGNVFRLEVPPEVYAAYLTDGNENEVLMQCYRETGDMKTAIQQFLNQQS